MDSREQRGLELAATKRFRRKGELWIVPSQRGSGSYVVDPQDGSCSCPDFETRGQRCKHVFAVVYTIKRETAPDGTTTVTETATVVKRATYKQNWSAYNLAQTREKARVAELLHALCKGIATPEQKGRGQRRHLLSDMIFAAAMKVYAASSARRFATDLLSFTDAGYLTKAPHYNSIFVYFENPELTPILKSLVLESATPLAAIEDSTATDGTGFTTSTKDNYFEATHEAAKQRRSFIKLHAMAGVRTHVVMAAHVTDGNEHDSPFLPALLDTAASRFTINEVSADKGYLSRSNLAAVLEKGAMPYIPFKSNSTGGGDDRIWNSLFHYFQYRRDEFLAHYHKRSNIETVFSMIKAKFGPAIRSKTDVAQKNEVYLKVLCHNLCVLVQSIYELGIEPVFWKDEAPAEVKVTA